MAVDVRVGWRFQRPPLLGSGGSFDTNARMCLLDPALEARPTRHLTRDPSGSCYRERGEPPGLLLASVSPSGAAEDDTHPSHEENACERRIHRPHSHRNHTIPCTFQKKRHAGTRRTAVAISLTAYRVPVEVGGVRIVRRPSEMRRLPARLLGRAEIRGVDDETVVETQKIERTLPSASRSGPPEEIEVGTRRGSRAASRSSTHRVRARGLFRRDPVARRRVRQAGNAWGDPLVPPSRSPAGPSTTIAPRGWRSARSAIFAPRAARALAFA